MKRMMRFATVSLAGAVAAGLVAAVAASGQTGTFATLLHEYRAGDADRALTAFASWDEARVRREATVPAGDSGDPWTRAAILLLYDEAAMRGGVGRRVYTDRAEPLIQELFREAKARRDDRLLAFVRDVRLVELVQGGTNNIWLNLEDWFPDDPLVRLALGARMEYAMPRIESAPGAYGFGDVDVVATTSHGRFGKEAARAIDEFQQALDLDPHLVEARLRLGRVLWQLDRWDEAERTLRQAQQDAREERQLPVAYLAGLFLGRMFEERGRTDAAVRAYGEAIEDCPAGQAGRLALGRLLVATGREEAGWTIAASALRGTDEEAGAARGADPWVTYWANHRFGRELQARYRALRPFIRTGR